MTALQATENASSAILQSMNLMIKLRGNYARATITRTACMSARIPHAGPLPMATIHERGEDKTPGSASENLLWAGPDHWKDLSQAVILTHGQPAIGGVVGTPRQPTSAVDWHPSKNTFKCPVIKAGGVKGVPIILVSGSSSVPPSSQKVYITENIRLGSP